MKLFIRNMVCIRCTMAVKAVLEREGLQPLQVVLGEAELKEELSAPRRVRLNQALKALGFELLDDKRSRLIEKIKNALVHLVHHSDIKINTNLSTYLSDKLHYEYTYLSNLFSEVEGSTIEKYFIAQRIEKVKELLLYDELSLAEIADRLGYSSAAYLSAQFKKITGFSPSHYRLLKENKRRNIEEL